MNEIAVVIPLFNKAPYIKRAIDSVISQPYQVKEIIVVDDGSTDNSAEVVNGIKDERIRLIRQQNAGESAARNRGIEEANFDLIAFLDADDEWKPDFLRTIQTLINNFPDCGAYATSSITILPNGNVIYPQINGCPPAPWMGIIPNFFELFQHGYPFIASSIVIPRKVLLDVGLFPVGVKISGDVDCWVRVAMKYPIAFSPAREVIYHQEAANRVGTIYKPIQQLVYVETIRQAIREDRLPIDLQPEALKFIALKQIVVASQNVMAGNPLYARKLLATCRQTKKYRRDWLWWCFWAAWPAGWPYKILQLKELLRKRTL